MAPISLLVILAIYLIAHGTEAWTGNFDSVWATKYVRRRVCAYQTWQACCRYKYTYQPQKYRRYFCSAGWTHTGNQNCNIPICSPSCSNGGTCTRPNKCSCRSGYFGPTCQGKLCSNTKPCYPGICSRSGSTSYCRCHTGFKYSSSGCRTLTTKPEIRQCFVRINQYIQQRKMEKFGLLMDSSNSTIEDDEIWTNRGLFNNVNYTGVAYYSPDNLPPVPSEYIRKVKIGIVGARFETYHIRYGGREIRLDPVNCPQNGVTVGMLNCTILNVNYDIRIDSGDHIKVTFTAEAGGYRELTYYNSNTLYRNQSYIGTSASKTVKFKFDFDRPTHCFPNCRNGETPIDFGGDVKQTPLLNITWSGWTDALSGVFRYAVEVFKLSANGDGALLEPKPLEPLKITEIMHSNSIIYPNFTLPEPGLYSIILQIADRANNSEYVRRFCLYDPNSNIETTTDVQSKLRVSSARPETNFTWQSDVNGEVSVDWTDFFYNPFLEDNKLLNQILEYPVQFEDEGPTEEKKVAALYKNREGRREDAVPNKKGVTQFEVAYHVDSNGGKDVDKVPLTWTKDFLNTTVRHRRNVNNGDTLVVVVKATDAVGHVLTRRTTVNFDSSKPEVEKITHEYSTTHQHISLNILAQDRESGISHIEWRFTRFGTERGSRGTVNWPRLERCNSIRECMCIERFDLCLPLEHTFVLTKAILGQGDRDLAGELQVEVKNSAYLSGGEGIYSFKIGEEEEDGGLSGGVIAGIIIAVLLLILIAVILVFLFVTNRPPFKRDRSAAYGAEPQGTASASAAFTNNAYNGGADDIYLYGGMEFTDGQAWQIPQSQLTLLGPITVGKFAKISQAQIKSRSEVVVAKMLKDDYTEDDALLMRAKVNFSATVVGQNPNIIEFIGAVVDNDALGPVIIYEYCEVGQLDKWLATQRYKVTSDVTEKLQRIAFGVCKGMTYLASKKIVHKRLAARNVLLTFILEAKITGFGPSKTDMNDDVDKERIPIKWTAPECMTSLKKANEKSDAWSFGVVLWEIFNLGETPYNDVRTREVEEKVRSGYRMSMPEYCDSFYHDIIRSCWEDNPKKRPKFQKMAAQIATSFFAQTGDDYYYYA